jgi:hypothetical protein
MPSTSCCRRRSFVGECPVPHWSHRSAPPKEIEGRTHLAFSHPTLAGIALVTVLVDPGEELLFLGDAVPGLVPLVPLLGARAVTLPMHERPDAAALWGAIGPRTRGVVLADPSEDELALLSETDVTVVLDRRDQALPEHFVGISIEVRHGQASLVLVHPEGAAHPLAHRLAHVASLLEPA